MIQALKRSDGLKSGRPPFPAVMMFNILVLQALYNFSYDQAEFVIQDFLSGIFCTSESIGKCKQDARSSYE